MKTLKPFIVLIVGYLCNLTSALATIQYASLPMYKPLPLATAAQGSQYGLFLNSQWEASKGTCKDLVPSGESCATGVFPLSVIDNYKKYPELLNGRSIRITDTTGQIIYGTIYDSIINVSTQTITFDLGIKQVENSFKFHNIQDIEISTNPYPQNPANYNLKPILLTSLPKNDMYFTRFNAYQPTDTDEALTLWGADSLTYGSEANSLRLNIGHTCADLISGLTGTCVKAEFYILSDEIQANPEALLGRQLTFSGGYGNTGTYHFISYDYVRDSYDNHLVYFYGQIDKKPPYPGTIDHIAIESTPEANVPQNLLELQYTHYGAEKLQIDSAQPLYIGTGSDHGLPVILPYNFEIDLSQPHNFITQQEWFSPNLQWSASEFNVSSLPYNEVIEVPAMQLGSYANALQLLNGRALNLTGNGTAIIYDSYSYTDGTSKKAIVDLYVKANRNIATLQGKITANLIVNPFPQNTVLFYWNPFGGMLASEIELDAKNSPLNPKLTQRDEETQSLNSQTWSSAGDSLPNVRNQCPIYASDPNVTPLGCTEISFSKKDLDHIQQAEFPLSQLSVQPDSANVPYFLVELQWDQNANAYMSDGNYFNIYDQDQNGDNVVLYVAGYNYTKYDVSLLNLAHKLQGEPNSPFTYALIKGNETYLHIAPQTH